MLIQYLLHKQGFLVDKGGGRGNLGCTRWAVTGTGISIPGVEKARVKSWRLEWAYRMGAPVSQNEPHMAPALWELAEWYFQDRSLRSLSTSLPKLLAVHWLSLDVHVLCWCLGKPSWLSDLWFLGLSAKALTSLRFYLLSGSPPEIVPCLLLNQEGLYPCSGSTLTLRPLTHSSTKLLSKSRCFSPMAAHKSLCLLCPGGSARGPLTQMVCPHIMW